MTFDCHEQIAATAIGLSDQIRTANRFALLEELATWCQREPEQAAQVLMCFAAWTDPDNPEALADRAEAVAAAAAVAQQRTASSVFEEVILRFDVTTETGVLPKGSRQLGRPEADGVWSIWMTGSRVATVPEATVRAGRSHRKTLLKSRDAHEEYEFARQWLGYSHAAAFRWLTEHFGVTDRQLFRWGITQQVLEVSA